MGSFVHPIPYQIGNPSLSLSLPVPAETQFWTKSTKPYLYTSTGLETPEAETTAGGVLWQIEAFEEDGGHVRFPIPDTRSEISLLFVKCLSAPDPAQSYCTPQMILAAFRPSEVKERVFKWSDGYPPLRQTLWVSHRWEMMLSRGAVIYPSEGHPSTPNVFYLPKTVLEQKSGLYDTISPSTLNIFVKQHRLADLGP